LKSRKAYKRLGRIEELLFKVLSNFPAMDRSIESTGKARGAKAAPTKKNQATKPADWRSQKAAKKSKGAKKALAPPAKKHANGAAKKAAAMMIPAIQAAPEVAGTSADIRNV
jgi:hypothetical protein